MKVLQLIDSLDSGGAERMAVNYANMLSGKVEESFLCATRNEGLLKDSINNDVDYLFLNKKGVIDFKAIKTLNSYVKGNKINVIHAHSTSFFLATIIKLLNGKIKLIWHDHYGNSEFLESRKYGILRLCSVKFNAIISVNKILKEWAENKLECNKVASLFNFVSINENEKKGTVLKGENDKRIICLANLRPQKNHFMLLEVFKNVVSINNKWTLHLVGKDDRNEYSIKIKKKIKDLNLENNVFIYGCKSDVYNILGQAEIGVLTSKSEGLPLALLEYGLSKLAVVVTNVGDCNKVITQKSEGLLVESENAEDFSKALLNYINNKLLRIENGKALYENVVTNFSDNKIKKQLLAIYSQ